MYFVIKQQCFDQLTPDNQTREVAGLFEAMEYFNLTEGHLLTLDEEDELRKDGWH